MRRAFVRLVETATRWAGSPAALALTTVVCAAWVARDSSFDFLDGASLVTLWLAVAIQASVVAEQDRQRRRDDAVHVKLDELITHLQGPRDEIAGIERR